MADVQNAMTRERRDILILDMFQAGKKSPEIQRVLASGGVRISERRINEIFYKALSKAAAQRRELGERIFDHKLSQLDMIIASNWGILSTPCVRCSGKGHVGQDPDKAPGVKMVCDRCKGVTKQFPARDRAAASKEVRQAVAEQCKLLGLYAPEKFAWTDTEGNDLDFRDELTNMDVGDLQKEWEVYQLAVADVNRHQREASPDG